MMVQPVRLSIIFWGNRLKWALNIIQLDDRRAFHQRLIKMGLSHTLQNQPAALATECRWRVACTHAEENSAETSLESNASDFE